MSSIHTSDAGLRGDLRSKPLGLFFVGVLIFIEVAELERDVRADVVGVEVRLGNSGEVLLLMLRRK